MGSKTTSLHRRSAGRPSSEDGVSPKDPLFLYSRHRSWLLVGRELKPAGIPSNIGSRSGREQLAVESVGEGVKDLSEGDHVVPIFNRECGAYSYCESGKTNQCSRLR
ncbi:hypothetical protein AMTRI_Chr07g25630 [Amborella trichopoda]